MQGGGGGQEEGGEDMSSAPARPCPVLDVLDKPTQLDQQVGANNMLQLSLQVTRVY